MRRETRSNDRRRPRRRRGGFTLVELLAVVAIVSVVVALVAVVSLETSRQADRRATQSLVHKLSQAVNDRLQALMTTSVEANGAHRYLAAVTPNLGAAPPARLPWGLPNEERARAIALIDFIKMEMPDSFIIQWPIANGQVQQGAPNSYPINFLGLPYPPNPQVLGSWNPAAAGQGDLAAILPLGNSVFPVYSPNLQLADPMNPMVTIPTYGPGATSDLIAGPFVNVGGGRDSRWERAGRGIYGASYAVAAGIYKQLGYSAQGTDGVDNNGDGYIDDWAEGVNGATVPPAEMLQRLSNHRPETARSEMLYALLVEGIGPFGSVFRPDDFAPNEIRDTDGDGLMEFVDSWGNPLQFYRAPVFYPQPGLQKGWFLDPVSNLNYSGYSLYEERQANPLDPNQLLVSIAWWSASNNVSDGIPFVTPQFAAIDPGLNLMSGRARATQLLFGPLMGDPANDWDRTGNPALGARQSYYSKPLILSNGPDGVSGLYQTWTDPNYLNLTTPADRVRAFLGVGPYNVFPGENNARPLTLEDLDGGTVNDNITNFKLEPTGGGLY